MKLSEFRRRIDALADAQTLHSDPEVTVRVYRNGVGGTPTSPIISVSPGFDWDSGKVIITTEDVLFCRKRKNSVSKNPPQQERACIIAI